MPNQDMLINYVSGEECRIAIVEDGKLEELYTERASDDIHVGNIYRGRITNVEPSIQAAFVDFGLSRNGFLHISDLHPRYFDGEDATERVGKRTPRKHRPPIQSCLKRGQNILVQVLKEGIGTKGPTLTSYLSIPGRFLVMMPDMERLGVSRKVEDENIRREMRRILDELNPPEDFGFIIRTAGMGRTKTELKRDLAYLLRLWKTIERRMKSGSGPAELYRESDLVIRTLRDVLSNDVQRVIVDDKHAAQRARDFLRIAMPRGATKVYFYDKPIPLFDAFDVERQIETINSRKVPLPSGGSLVVDTTEAMVAIDVNSGRFRDKGDAESTAYHTNQEAVDEIARQLRLRDLGGVVVLDLIDMYQNKHRREIERRFRENLKQDRARTKTLRIDELGLLAMTRQRMRPSLKRSLHRVCDDCNGTGIVKTAESVVLDVMRQLAVVMSNDKVHRVELTITPEAGAMLLNRKRQALHRLEEQLAKRVEINFDATLKPDAIRLLAFDSRGVQLDLEKLPHPKPPTFQDSDTFATDDVNFDDEDILEEEEMSPPQSAPAAVRQPADAPVDQPPQAIPTGAAGSTVSAGVPGSDGGHRRRRRGRRGGRRHRKNRNGNLVHPESAPSGNSAMSPDAPVSNGDQAPAPVEVQPASQDQPPVGSQNSGDPQQPHKRHRRRGRRGGRRHRRPGQPPAPPQIPAAQTPAPAS